MPPSNNGVLIQVIDSKQFIFFDMDGGIIVNDA